MSIITLEQVLMEAEGLHINSSPEKMAQSKRADRRNDDYTISSDQEIGGDEDDNEPGNEEDTPTNDYTNPDDENEAGTDETDNAAGNADETSVNDQGANDESPNDATDDADNNTDYTDSEDADEGDFDDDTQDEDASTDYTEDGDQGDSGATDDNSDSPDDSNMDNDSGTAEESDDQIKERDRKVKQLFLLRDMNTLYIQLGSFRTKVANMEKSNILFSTIQNTVCKNFDKIRDVIYKYILYYFDAMSYEYNLYIYNYFIECCKVNLELLNNIKDKSEVIY